MKQKLVSAYQDQLDRLDNAPLGTKAPAFTGGHWIKVENGWKWFCGDTFPRPGGDWNGHLIYPDEVDEEREDLRKDFLSEQTADAVGGSFPNLAAAIRKHGV